MAVQSPRTLIADELVTLLSGINTSILEIDGVTPKYNTKVLHCQRKLAFIDEVETNETPAIYITAGTENRQYNPSRTKTKHILYIIRGYIVDEDDSDGKLNNLISDVELVIDDSYMSTQLNGLVTDIRIVEITTDEGLLHPEAVFEMILDATLVETY